MSDFIYKADSSGSREQRTRRLADAVGDAIAQARAGLAPLLRICLDLPPSDPWLALELAGPGEVAIGWQTPSPQQTVAAFGTVAEVAATTHDRFAEIERACTAQAGQILTVDASGAQRTLRGFPLWLGGFAFGTEPENSRGAWQGWPSACFTLPAVLVVANTGTCTAIMTQRIGADDHPHAILERIVVTRERLSAALAAPRPRAFVDGGPGAKPDAPCPTDELPGPAWIERAQHARATMNAGGLQKIVLARNSVYDGAQARHTDWLRTLYALRDRHGDCTTYAFRRRDGSTLVGATPETLIHLSGRRIVTAAIAGTAPRHRDHALDDTASHALASSSKERHEHQLVVEAMATALRPRCRALDIAEEPRLRKLRLVQHLETTIDGELAQREHVLALVAALHPTPAVGGWPTKEALAWINRHEPFARGWYAGPIGWFDSEGGGHFVVALRCALLRESRAWAYAGAGLTNTSQPGAEWEETSLKLGTIAESLAWRSTAP